MQQQRLARCIFVCMPEAGSPHSVKRSSLEQEGGRAWDWIERMETFLKSR